MAESADSAAPMPREVRTASILLLALGVTVLASAATSLAFRADATAAATKKDTTGLLSASMVGTVVLAAGIVLAVLGVLLVLAGVQVRRGRQWARVLAFVVSGLMIALTAVGALAGAGVLAVVMLGASVGVVAFLMQSSVTPFFTRRPEPAPSGPDGDRGRQ